MWTSGRFRERVPSFPDVGDRVETDDVHAPVAEEEHVVRHVVQDDRVLVVEVPLVGIEGGHDHLARLLAPGEVAGCRLGEDFGDRLFIFVRDVPVVVEEIPGLGEGVSGAGGLRPGVVLARVVHDEVEAEGHAVPPAVVGQGFEVFHGAELRVHVAEVRDRIAAVAPAFRALEDGHEVQVVDARLFEVVEVFPDALQRAVPLGARAAEGLDVHQHAEEVPALVPVRLLPSLFVEFLERRLPVVEVVLQHGEEVVVGFLVMVQLHVERFQFFFRSGQALLEDEVVFLAHKVLFLTLSCSCSCGCALQVCSAAFFTAPPRLLRASAWPGWRRVCWWSETRPGSRRSGPLRVRRR